MDSQAIMLKTSMGEFVPIVRRLPWVDAVAPQAQDPETIGVRLIDGDALAMVTVFEDPEEWPVVFDVYQLEGEGTAKKCYDWFVANTALPIRLFEPDGDEIERRE